MVVRTKSKGVKIEQSKIGSLLTKGSYICKRKFIYNKIPLFNVILLQLQLDKTEYPSVQDAQKNN